MKNIKFFHNKNIMFIIILRILYIKQKNFLDLNIFFLKKI
jgi:hypothetical protein